MIKLTDDNGFEVQINEDSIRGFGLSPASKETLFVNYGDKEIHLTKDPKRQYRQLLRHFGKEKIVGIKKMS